MANQLTIKQAASVKGTFKASAFNEEGAPVLGPWQEFNVGSDMVWDPAKYGAEVTSFYIGKGIGPDVNNSFVAYAVHIDFTKDTKDATITLGIDQVASPGNNGCYYFKVESAEGIDYKIITDGNPVAGTELPERCQ